MASDKCCVCLDDFSVLEMGGTPCVYFYPCRHRIDGNCFKIFSANHIVCNFNANLREDPLEPMKCPICRQHVSGVYSNKNFNLPTTELPLRVFIDVPLRIRLMAIQTAQILGANGGITVYHHSSLYD